MSNRNSRRVSRPVDPMGTLPMFDSVTGADGRVVAAGRFRCGTCNTLVVAEAGQVCPACAEVVTTTSTKTRTRKSSRHTSAQKTTARKPTATKTTKGGG